LRPLARRDFALLAFAWTVSLLGDGFFHVALAWQVYLIDNDPRALAFVGFVLSLSIVISSLVGGLLADRYDARTVLVWADIVRGVPTAVMGLLSAAGALEVWHIALLMVPIGFGNMLFNPAAFAILPRIVPAEELPQANAVRSTIRPLMMTLIGPAIGGIVVGMYGPAPAILINASSFFVSAVAVLAMRRTQVRAPAAGGLRKTFDDLVGGFRYAWRARWLLIALTSGTLTIVFYDGPLQVLLPFRIKNDLGAGADDLGLIYAAGGAAAVVTGFVVAQLGVPRRLITAMYWSWALSVLSLAAYGLVSSVWQAALASALAQSLFTVAVVVWFTLLQQRVPQELLGRISSLDWLFSTALSPFSYLLTAPAAQLFGVQGTLVGAGLLGFVVTILLWALPAARAPERALLAARS
jgi:MFS family permease